MADKNAWILPPTGDDEYLVVRVSKDIIEEGDVVGEIKISLSPASNKTFRKGAVQPLSVCCDGLCWSK